MYDMSYVDLPLSHSKLLPFIVQGSKLELRLLPSHLEYVFLGEGENLPVIISCKLTTLEEEKLIQMLKHHKEAIEWTIAGIKGLSGHLYAQNFVARKF